VRVVATIGVYGATVSSFLEALEVAGVDVVIDVRARRGLRGPQYAWANVTRLLGSLDEAGLAYQHWKDAAPTPGVRAAQHRSDAELGMNKRERTQLSEGFVAAYHEQVLSSLDRRELLTRIEGTTLPALLCVEQDPRACHREALAAFLAEEVVHLRG
jgi:uncharacterized protein (DUF488 family)